jgi:hypothetical protein
MTSNKRTTGEWIVQTIKQNPEGLLLLAAGAVLMMRTNSDGSSRTPAPWNGGNDGVSNAAGSDLAESLADSARRTMQEAGSYASSAVDAARDAADAVKSYASSATDFANQARQKVGEQSDRVIRQTQTMGQRILQDQPLALVVAGLAAGAALAAAFPPTEIEKNTLGPAAAAAGRFGEQVKRATAKAGEKLRTSTEERGLHGQGLKEVAEEVVDTFNVSMSETHPGASSHFQAHTDDGDNR